MAREWVVDFGYRELAARRERVLARCSEAARVRILGLPPVLVVGKTHAITVHLGTGMRTVERVWSAQPSPIAVEPGGGRQTQSYFRILDAVCATWEISLGQLQSNSRNWRFTRPRFAGYRLARELLGWSMPKIGRAFRRDHKTIQSGLLRAAELHESDPHWRQRYDRAHAVLTRGAR